MMYEAVVETTATGAVQLKAEVRHFLDGPALEELKLEPVVLPGGMCRRVRTGQTMRGGGKPERPGMPGRRRRRGGGDTEGRRIM